METSLNRIKELATQKEDENWEFRQFLKGYDGSLRRLDALVRRLYHETAAQIDCLACANCCKVLSMTVSKADVTRIAAGLSLSPAELRARHFRPPASEELVEKGRLLIAGEPCSFLAGNSCTIYEFRPRNCRDFPHLDKPDFVFRTMNVIWNCSVCPIVFNVYEALKLQLGFR